MTDGEGFMIHWRCIGDANEGRGLGWLEGVPADIGAATCNGASVTFLHFFRGNLRGRS
jgi:hypothetical protein